jgi:hypothetical protein
VDLTESDWNRALRSWFFRPDLAGRPAYLAVDEESLAAIAQEFGPGIADGPGSLLRAVRSRINSYAPLEWWTRRAVQWRLGGWQSDPPFLSILSVTVLAATIVDDVNDRSYYRRLNDLLAAPGVGMPRYFDSDIQQLWTYLNEWLTDVRRGELGTATASNAASLANVGWAQSQTLMRSSDRAKLPLFFSAIGMRGAEHVDGAVLVRRLRAWSSGGATVSRRLAAVLADSRLAELLAAALESELATWDGTFRDEAGRMALRLQLAFHERSGQLQAAMQVPEQLAGTKWQIGALQTDLDLGQRDDWQILPLPVTPVMLDGQSLKARPAPPPRGGARDQRQLAVMTVFMPRRDVHLMCPDDRLARWVEVPSALLHRPHLVLVRSRLEADGVALMQRLGPDVTPVRRMHRPPGWAAYRFTPARLLAADGPLAVLSPRGNELSALDGGLPISKRRRIYLTDGAPDLLLDTRESLGTITVDGARVRSAVAGRLRLADLHLSAGDHSVTNGGVHYQLVLTDGYTEEPRDTWFSLCFHVQANGDLGLRSRSAGMTSSVESPAANDAMVSGAALWLGTIAQANAPAPQPVRARAGGRHFALGNPGQVAEIHPRPPRWLQSLSISLRPYLIDAGPALESVPFDSQWLLRVSAGGITVSATSRHPVEARNSHDALPAADLWQRMTEFIARAAPDPGEEAAWNRWKQAALTKGTDADAESP